MNITGASYWRQALLFSIVIILGVTAPGLPAYADSGHIPHENPATAVVSWENIFLLLSYNDITTLIAGQQYQDAQSALDDMSIAVVPENLETIHTRFKNLCQQQLTDLNNAETLLETAAYYYSLQDIGTAEGKISQAEETLDNASDLLTEMEAAASILGDTFDIFSFPATSDLRLAYSRFGDSLMQIGNLIRELDKLRSNIHDNPQLSIATKQYYSTKIDFSAPATVYPGIAFTINGTISSNGDEISRTVTIYIDDTWLAEEITTEMLSIEVTLPEYTASGKHQLTASAAAEGQYSSAARTVNINVTTLPIRLETKIPGIIFLPQKINFFGQVYQANDPLSPIVGAQVKLTMDDITGLCQTSTDGMFDKDMEISNIIVTPLVENPFAFYTSTGLRGASLFGLKEITISITPQEPWFSSLETRFRIFTFNTLNVISILVITILIAGWFIYRQIHLSTRQVTAIQTSEPGEIQEITLPPSTTKPVKTQLHNRALSAYYRGLAVVEKASAIVMTPSLTLREFVSMVHSLPADIEDKFSELTGIAEIALYAQNALVKESANRAEQLATTIQKELGHET
jgi:tetratricopeptide (TPR) repeat protein